MFKCTLSLGTNLGNREENINTSLSLIRSKISQSLICVSEIIETEAMLLEKSPLEWNIPFLNCVISFYTNLAPWEVFQEIKKIEIQMGRNLLAPRWSPRIIDIDILYYDDREYKDGEITIPHIGIQSRDFLLKLLSQMNP